MRMQFRRMGYQVVDWIADYYKGLDTRKQVKPTVQVRGTMAASLALILCEGCAV